MKRLAMILGGTWLLVMLGVGMTLVGAPHKADTAPPTAEIQPSAQTPAPLTPVDDEEDKPEEPLIDHRTETIRRYIEEMTLEQKVGQLFFARCPDGDEAQTAKQYHPGGYILFGRDFEKRTPDSLREMLESCQQEASIPMLIGVDEEGGTVVRASAYTQFRPQKFQSPRKVYQTGGMNAIVEDAKDKAAFLKNLGINVNLSPVCDVSTDPEDFIYPRAFGLGTEETVQFVRETVKAMQGVGVGAVLKHFPGYGPNSDTHTGAAVDDRPLTTFETSDFLPFSAGVNAGAGCVLISHNTVIAMDPEKPASLSPKVHDILRSGLQFAGVALTDDLDMDAVSTFVADGDDAAVMAILAGNDMVIVSDLDKHIPAVLEAVAEETISEVLIDVAVTRVLGWKYDLGLIA